MDARTENMLLNKQQQQHHPAAAAHIPLDIYDWRINKHTLIE